MGKARLRIFFMGLIFLFDWAKLDKYIDKNVLFMV